MNVWRNSRRRFLGLTAAVCGGLLGGNALWPDEAAAQGFGVNAGTPTTTSAGTNATTGNASIGALTPSTEFGAAAGGRGPQLGTEEIRNYQIGMTVTAQGGPCRGIFATAPVPIDWPEQHVIIVKEDITPSVQAAQYRIVGGTVKQMLVSMPYIAAGDEAKALVTLEVHRHSLVAPTDTSVYVLPNEKKMPKELRIYLTPSPAIESNHSKIRAIAKELATEHKDADAWKRVEAIYDWVREKVEYKKGPLKGAIRSLADGTGDCEELSSLFIAICRASNIPARIVWVPDHCYPEFYLEDREGKGYWFPCQAAGSREFGGITEHRPILQKGDNFQVPEKKERMRYVSEYLTGKGGNPKVRFHRQQLGALE